MVTIEVAPFAPLNVVWRTLTEPAIVEQWIDVLKPGSKEGHVPGLDFRDRVLTLSQTSLESACRLGWAWQLLDTGPTYQSEWSIVSNDYRCVVQMTYREP